MKNLFLSILLLTAKTSFTQVAIHDSCLVESDSTLKYLNEFLTEYAKIMSTWSPEKKNSAKFLYMNGVKLPYPRSQLSLINKQVLFKSIYSC